MAAIQSSHTPNWALSLLLVYVNRVVTFIYKILWYMKQYPANYYPPVLL